MLKKEGVYHDNDTSDNIDSKMLKKYTTTAGYDAPTKLMVNEFIQAVYDFCG